MRFKKELESHLLSDHYKGMSLNAMSLDIFNNDKEIDLTRGTIRKYLGKIQQEQTSEITPFRRLFLDIETSPNIGWFWRSAWKTNIGPGQIIEERRVITVSWKWEGDDKVQHLNWDKNKCDKELLTKLSSVINEADEVIAHNGDRFDIPWLRTRCLYHRVPFNTYIKSVDTLKKVKSAFNFQSNKLDYIAEFLGFGNKKPSGIGLWMTLTFDDVKSQEYKEALAKMHEYCDHDVVLLEDVYRTIISYIKPSTHVGISMKQGRHSCPNCGSTHIHYKRHTVTATGIVKRHMGCNDCDSDYIVPDTVYKKWQEVNS